MPLAKHIESVGGAKPTYLETRYKLMPYLYTTAEEMARTGVPIMRPLFVEFPNVTKGQASDRSRHRCGVSLWT
jgi:alpha-glucosidase (family GH31 glycosyl hydrolase)